MKKLFLIPLLLLAACEPSNRGADGYTFKEAEYVKSDPQTIRFYPVTDQAELEALFLRQRKVAMPEGLAAFGVLRPDLNQCDVYFIDARIDYQPEWIGHEITHCVYGRFH